MPSDPRIDQLLSVWDSAPVKPSLEELCRTCPDLLEPLRRRVKALEEADRFLDADRLLDTDRRLDTNHPSPTDNPSTTQRLSPPPQAKTSDPDPRNVGQYRILGRIGEGGMGVVYRAEQREPVRRLVALKLIKLGMDTREVIARFEAERQALAMMNHPNVAKVLEAGVTDSGRPFFAMELVQGVDFVKFCQDEKLSVRQRLELFIPVCQAVQHAHQKGIIHRDLKPTNILVQLIDAKPVPKVIDFGIAKATNQVLTQHTLFTQTGSMIGTPEYMSPEQAMTSGLDVDTRTDIYSLGVILYQLLTGTLPIDPKALRQAGLEGMAKLIKTSEPQRPSTRLLKSAAGSSDTPPTALTRNSKLLHKELQADLDWIVLKAMEKDRARRYETASALATDLQRHLDGETVLARPPSTVYRLQKFVHKHRGPVIAATTVLVALVLAVVSLGVAVIRVRYEKNAANEATAQAKLDRDAAQIALEDSKTQRVVSERESKRAIAAEESTKLRSMDIRVRQADALTLANRIDEARDEYRKAIAEFNTSNLSPFSAQVGLVLANLKSPPPLLVFRANQNKETVYSVAFSADGSHVFSGGWDRYVRCWNLLTGQVSSLDVRPYGVKTVVCGADPHTAIAVDSAGAVRTCKFEDGIPPRGTTWDADAQASDISADGRFALVPDEQLYRIIDVGTARQFGQVPAKSADVTFYALSPDGQRLMLGTTGNRLEFWNVPSSTLQWQTIPDQAVHCAAFTAAGDFAIIGTGESGLQILDLGQKTLTRPLQGHRGMVNCVAFSPDGRTAISGSSDHTVRLWNWRDGREVCCYHGHTEAVMGVAFSPDGRTAVSGGADGAVILWPVPRESAQAFDDPDHTSNVAISADGRIALAGCDDGSLKLWDVRTGCLLHHLQGLRDRIDRVALSADGTRAVAVTGVGVELLVCDVGTNRVRVLTDASPILSVAVSPEGAKALCGREGAATLWDLQRAAAIPIDGHSGEVKAVAFNADGHWATSASRNLVRHDLSPPTPGQKQFGTSASPVQSIAIDPDGNRALTGDADGVVRAWEIAAEKSTQLGKHTNYVTGVAFGPQARTAISGSQDRSLRMWDVNTAAEIRILADPIEAITGFALSKDFTTLATTGTTDDEHHLIRTWNFAHADAPNGMPGKWDPAPKNAPDQKPDGAPLVALGEYYALRGKFDWAVAVLELARNAHYSVDPALLGQCYWALSRDPPKNGPSRSESLTSAEREFEAATTLPNPRTDSYYLNLCLSAVKRSVVQDKQNGARGAPAGGVR